jgi:hypothetical protein
LSLYFERCGLLIGFENAKFVLVKMRFDNYYR